MGKIDGQPGPFHLSPLDRVLEKHCYYTFVCLVVDDGLLLTSLPVERHSDLTATGHGSRKVRPVKRRPDFTVKWQV